VITNRCFTNRRRDTPAKQFPALGEDFHRNALMQLPASRSENRAEGFGYAPIVADHPTDVFRMNSQFKDSYCLSLDRANLHSFWMVHKCLCDCL
jgi:hypothetical protein